MLFDSPSSFGRTFRILTFGESHGAAVGVVLDGVKPGLPFDLEAIQTELDRRRPGQSELVTPRSEARPGAGALRRLRRADHGPSHRPGGVQREPAERRLCRHPGPVPARPCGLSPTSAKYGLRDPAGGGAPVAGRPWPGWRRAPGPSSSSPPWGCGSGVSTGRSPGSPDHGWIGTSWKPIRSGWRIQTCFRPSKPPWRQPWRTTTPWEAWRRSGSKGCPRDWAIRPSPSWMRCWPTPA